MIETKLDEASEKTSLFHSTRNSGPSVGGAAAPGRDRWRAATSRLFLHPTHRQQQVRPKTYHHLYRHHKYHNLQHKNNQQQPEEKSPSKQQSNRSSHHPQRCNADQTSTVHQHHKKILLHHHHHQHHPPAHHHQPLHHYSFPSIHSRNEGRKSLTSHPYGPHLHQSVHRHNSPLVRQKQKGRKKHFLLMRDRPSVSLTGAAGSSSSAQHISSSTRPSSVATFPATECPRCKSAGLRSQQYQHQYSQQYQRRQQLHLIGIPAAASRTNPRAPGDTDSSLPTTSSGTSVQHCCAGAHPPSRPPGAIITTAAPLSDSKNIPTISDDQIIFIWDSNYIRSFEGIIRLLQVILSVLSLICLTTAGRKEGGYLSLPLCWHFRIMVFVLVLTLLSSFVIWAAHVTSVASAFPINWHFLDMVVYSVFAFLYLVGASLVASAFDFYEKMQVGVGYQTIQQLISSVIIGYICLFLYGATAVIGYRQWRLQMDQCQQQKLLEEDDYEI